MFFSTESLIESLKGIFFYLNPRGTEEDSTFEFFSEIFFLLVTLKKREYFLMSPLNYFTHNRIWKTSNAESETFDFLKKEILARFELDGSNIQRLGLGSNKTLEE